MKERQRPIKNTRGNPAQPKTSRTSVSPKFKSVNKHGATYSCIVRTLRVVSYRCYVATAEWLSSAVQNTAGNAQCKRSKRSSWHKPGRTDLWWKNIWTGVEPEDDVGKKTFECRGLVL